MWPSEATTSRSSAIGTLLLPPTLMPRSRATWVAMAASCPTPPPAGIRPGRAAVTPGQAATTKAPSVTKSGPHQERPELSLPAVLAPVQWLRRRPQVGGGLPFFDRQLTGTGGPRRAGRGE